MGVGVAERVTGQRPFSNERKPCRDHFLHWILCAMRSENDNPPRCCKLTSDSLQVSLGRRGVFLREH